MPTPHIRVLCVDDHRIVREGLALIMNRQPDFEVVGSAANGREAIALFRVHRPDVTLMDLQLPQMSGLEVIRTIRREDPEARIVVLTMYTGDEDVRAALGAGATTYLVKDIDPDELLHVLREVYAGKRPIRPETLTSISSGAAQSTLSPRETQVLELIARGHRNKEIATSLGIAELTVEAHVRSILVKLEVHDRTAAVYVAARRGIIHITQSD